MRINDWSFSITILPEPVFSSLLPLFSRIASILYYLAALPIIYFVLPSVLAVLPQKPQFLLKCIVVLLATLAMSVAGCFISIVCAILDKRYAINYIVSRLFSHLAAKPCGVTYRIVGEEHLETYPAIVVCNHQSSMDMMVLGRVFPKHCVVMAKKELLYFPFLGMFSKYLCFVSIIYWNLCAQGHFFSQTKGITASAVLFAQQSTIDKTTTTTRTIFSLQFYFQASIADKTHKDKDTILPPPPRWDGGTTF